MSKYFFHRPNRCQPSFLISKKIVDTVNGKSYLSRLSVISLNIVSINSLLFIWLYYEKHCTTVASWWCL